MDDRNDDWISIVANIKKDKVRWAQICNMLTKPNIPMKFTEYYYIAVLQMVLLYGEEIHHRVSSSLSTKGFWKILYAQRLYCN